MLEILSLALAILLPPTPNHMQRVLLFLALSLYGFQSFSAEFKGRILDADNKEALIGANIIIVGSNRGETTDINGRFHFKNLPAGTYTFKLSYIGYEAQDLEITLAENQLLERDLFIKPGSEELQTVLVQARMRGQYRALNQQKNAENIQNIVDAEQIQSFPDLNAADALQRITGITLQRDQGEGKYVQLRGTPPEFTNFNVNGIQLPSPESEIRTVGMDVINASQIQTIIVSKVLRPDMNADAIGGNVNLKTKRAESTEPEIKAVLAGGINNLRQTGNGEFQFTFAQRKERFGFLVNANYTYTDQGADNIEFKYDKGVFFGDTGRDNYHLQYSEVQLRHYNIVRQRTGLSATLDYHYDDRTTFYLSGMFNNYTDDEVRRRKVYTLDDATSERSYLYGGIEHDLKDRHKEQSISMLNLGAEHNFYRAKINYELSWSEAIERQPNRMEVVFDNPGQAINIRFDMSDPEYPKATFPKLTNSSNATDWDNYEMDKLLFEDHLAIDRNLVGRFDVEVPYRSAMGTGYFKIGSLIRGKDKSRDIRAASYGAYRPTSNLYPIPGDTLSLSRVADDFYDGNLLDQGYVMEVMPNGDKMRDFFEEFQSLFIYGSEGITETRERTFGQDYVATENVYAGYAMVKHDIGKLMILTGLRFEQTDINYQGYRIFKSSSSFITGMDTISNSRSQAFTLPNLQFKYQLQPDFNIRAALTYSYARPNFRDVIPYRVQAERNEVQFGNPDINYPLATNVDFLAEKYWGAGNMVSGGYFFKRIDDFIFNYRINGFEGDPREANLSRVQVEIPLNGKAAFVHGVELQSQFMTRWWPGFWNNFGFFGNYTFTASEAIINERLPANDFSNIILFGEDYTSFFNREVEEVIPLPGQSPHSLNLAIFYDTPKFYVKVAANFTDSYLYTLGADEDLDEYYAANWRVDFNAYYQINKTVQIFADVRNVTNQPLKFYLGKPEEGRVRQQEFYSFWARLGMRINL